jgi:fructose-1,6-bisphosphatase/inositol monophosphatase family enzyme
VVIDPFDQSFATTRSIRQGSIGICVVSTSLVLLSAVVADLSAGISYVATPEGAFAIGATSPGKRVRIRPASTEILTKAFVVIPGISQNRRRSFLDSRVTVAAERVMNTDGIVNFGRIAAGYIDAYLDPSIGKPAYEMTYAVIPQVAGAVVTDGTGTPFDLATTVEQFKLQPGRRFTFIVASTPKLHSQLLTGKYK